MNKGVKDIKFPVILLIVCIAVALVMGIIVGGAPQRHNDSLKKTISKTLTPIAEDCGLKNFDVVYVDDQYSVKIVLQYFTKKSIYARSCQSPYFSTK